MLSLLPGNCLFLAPVFLTLTCLSNFLLLFISSCYSLSHCFFSCLAGRDHPVFCALVNGEGEVTDFLRLPHFTKRRTAWREEERERKASGWDGLPSLHLCTCYNSDGVSSIPCKTLIISDLVIDPSSPGISLVSVGSRWRSTSDTKFASGLRPVPELCVFESCCYCFYSIQHLGQPVPGPESH